MKHILVLILALAFAALPAAAQANLPADSIAIAVRVPAGYAGNPDAAPGSAIPSWQWPGWEGKAIEVEVVSHYPEIMLICNGVVVDKKAVPADTGGMVTFSLPYEPGIITAVGIGSGMPKISQLKTGD